MKKGDIDLNLKLAPETVFATEKFNEVYSRLPQSQKEVILDIAYNTNQKYGAERIEYLKSLYKGIGGSLMSGKYKIYHLTPFKHNDPDRIYYIYANDLKPNMVVDHKRLRSDAVIFLYYSKDHDKKNDAVRWYSKTRSLVLREFNKPIYKTEKESETNLSTFWLWLTPEQAKVKKIKQPASIKGSAGTGKTFISFELFKDWAKDGTQKLLYLTYTQKLINRAKRMLRDDGLNIEHENISILKFDELFNEDEKIRIIGEKEARNIIKEIVEKRQDQRNLKSIIFSDYFVYSYIRGIMKGFYKPKVTGHEIDRKGLEGFIYSIVEFRQYQENIFRQVYTYLKNDYLTSHSLNQIFRRVYKKKKYTFNEWYVETINSYKKDIETIEFLSDDKLISELTKDLNIEQAKILIDIKNQYNKELKEIRTYDDNDHARAILNKIIEEKDKYDGIIVDEVQDLTEIQVEAISKLLKKDSVNISFFGDPNQTINPTVYDYGRFNASIYQLKSKFTPETMKETYRCGEHLLEYINHLVNLREKYKLTTNREDLQEEKSARKEEGNYPVLIENEELMSAIFEKLGSAESFLLIVDKESTRTNIINRIKNIIQDEDIIKNIDEDIITVQNSKGLEASNVIMYNILSDNLDIFEDLINDKTENNKVSAMTFNKFYVSVTRARNTVLICETKLNNYSYIKDVMFYSKGKKLLDSFTEDDIPAFLDITADPEIFYYQSKELITDEEFEKAYKKNNIAIKHLINQFDKDDNLISVPNDIQSLKTYQELTSFSSETTGVNLEEFRKKYYELIEEINAYLAVYEELFQSEMDLLDDDITLFNEDEQESLETIKYRYDMFLDMVNYKEVYDYKASYDEDKEKLKSIGERPSNEEILEYCHVFINTYNNFLFVYLLIDNMEVENVKDYHNVMKVLENKVDFRQVEESFYKVDFPKGIKDDFSKKILESAFEEYKDVLDIIIDDIKEMI